MRVTRRADLGSEDGAVLVIMALAVPVTVLLLAMAMDFGNWYVHKRQLQSRVDAGALAAGVAYGPNAADCLDPPNNAAWAAAGTRIRDTALRYAGAPGGFNTSVGDAAAGVTITVNDPCYSHGTQYWTDVSADASKVPSFFSGFGVPRPKIVAGARVQLMEVGTATGMLPFTLVDPTTPTPPTKRLVDAVVDCAPGDSHSLAQTVARGCNGPFTVSKNQYACASNTGTANADALGPFDCLTTVDAAGLSGISAAYNQRWAPAGTCTENRWPDTPVGDPRLISVFVTPPTPTDGALRITGLVGFYVTGWEGAPGSCSNETAPAGSTTGSVWGRVVRTYVIPAGQGSAASTPCAIGTNTNTITFCVAALVQ
jgi:hypothetical protein